MAFRVLLFQLLFPTSVVFASFRYIMSAQNQCPKRAVWCTTKAPEPGPSEAVSTTQAPFSQSYSSLSERRAKGGITRNQITPESRKQNKVARIQIEIVGNVVLSDGSGRPDFTLPSQAYLRTHRSASSFEVSFSQIKYNTEYTTNFTPIVTTAAYPDEQSYLGTMFEDSTGLYALALQTGSQIAKFWGLTDKLNGEISSVNDPPLVSTFRTQYSSLPEAIVELAASKHNASQNGPRTTSSDTYGGKLKRGGGTAPNVQQAALPHRNFFSEL
ncbi:hypothetical protein EV360DRAFT_74351 [Lentinula raphanica]|nr:hypothetical protein EV360DRAFT_74351 [Lentinula raphanica]